MKSIFSIFFIATALTISAAKAEFIGNLEFIPEGCVATGICTIKNDFEFKDSQGVRWQTKAQDKTDGASIPTWAPAVRQGLHQGGSDT